MKKSLYILSFLIVICVLLDAQTFAHKTIVDELNTDYPGQGTVRVLQDESINQTIEANSVSSNAQLYVNGDHKQLVDGYRIQAFSGNDPKQSRNDAYVRRDRIMTEYPGMSTYVSFTAPFWRLRVGDFTNRADALQVLNEMKAKFPIFGKEMYIVSDEVNTTAN